MFIYGFLLTALADIHRRGLVDEYILQLLGSMESFEDGKPGTTVLSAHIIGLEKQGIELSPLHGNGQATYSERRFHSSARSEVDSDDEVGEVEGVNSSDKDDTGPFRDATSTFHSNTREDISTNQRDTDANLHIEEVVDIMGNDAPLPTLNMSSFSSNVLTLMEGRNIMHQFGFSPRRRLELYTGTLAALHCICRCFI